MTHKEEVKQFIKEELRKKLFLHENIITPPNIPNTKNFFHGGNLNDYNDNIAQKNGRYEYGPGLYITTHYDTAKKYAKGSRKLYIVTAELGNDINNSVLNYNTLLEFINTYVIKTLRKLVIERLQRFIDENNKVKAYVFNNIILNNKAIKPTNTQVLRQFYVDNNIDYEMVHNPFGWGEDMMVLYNMKKIKNILQVGPNDKLQSYEL
jgi:hypothetical protein